MLKHFKQVEKGKNTKISTYCLEGLLVKNKHKKSFQAEQGVGFLFLR